jgi:hypothetical protein
MWIVGRLCCADFFMRADNTSVMPDLIRGDWSRDCTFGVCGPYETTYLFEKKHQGSPMTSLNENELSLFGEWPEKPCYSGGVVTPPSCVSRPGHVADGLERKSVPPVQSGTSADGGADDLRLLLNEMTGEMRQQFEFFRTMREHAGPLVETEGDDAAGKQARSDVKSSTDAMSLIIRTLEKIDTLQRQLARDRQEAAEREMESDDYEEAVAFFQRRIEKLADEKFHARCRAAGISPHGEREADG